MEDVEDDDLMETPHSAFDAASICTMDVVEEHRYRPHNSVLLDQASAAAPPPAPRPRSPSIYSMFVTDHTHSKPRCKNPSVYSMPIAAYRARDDFDGDIGDLDEDEDDDDEGEYDGNDGSESDGVNSDNDVHPDDRVFMTKRSQRVAVRKQNGSRHTNMHHHMNFRTRVKNPSVYSMPILGSNRETPAPHELRVAPLVPLPFAEEEGAASGEKMEYPEDGAEYSPLPHGHANPRLTRVASRRVRPASMRDNIANGFTSCRGRPNDDSLPPSYHVAVCMGFLGVLLLFGGMAMAIVGFTSSPDMNNEDTLKALRVLGPLALSVGILMCIGCFVYMCVVYLRYKRLSAYLKRRHSARRVPTAPEVTTQVEDEAAQAEATRVMQYHNPENAAEDIRQMLQDLKTQGEGVPLEPPESARR